MGKVLVSKRKRKKGCEEKVILQINSVSISGSSLQTWGIVRVSTAGLPFKVSLPERWSYVPLVSQGEEVTLIQEHANRVGRGTVRMRTRLA